MNYFNFTLFYKEGHKYIQNTFYSTLTLLYEPQKLAAAHIASYFSPTQGVSSLHTDRTDGNEKKCPGRVWNLLFLRGTRYSFMLPQVTEKK